jgi:thioester reductase-like protein
MFVLVTGATGFLGRCLIENLLTKTLDIKALIRQCYPELF